MKGGRFVSRVGPPLNARCIVPPVRAFWPFVPRPEVLPRPEPCPRPTRFTRLCEPGAGRKSESFMRLLPLPIPDGLLSESSHAWRDYLPAQLSPAVYATPLPVYLHSRV